MFTLNLKRDKRLGGVHIPEFTLWEVTTKRVIRQKVGPARQWGRIAPGEATWMVLALLERISTGGPPSVGQ